MAMRLYTKEEFEAELKDLWGLEPTEYATATSRAWKTPKGNYITVPILPEGERYPDYYVDHVVKELKRLDLDD